MTAVEARQLSRLVGLLLVQREPSRRYHLHSFIREAAARKTNLTALRVAHARHFAGRLVAQQTALLHLRAEVLAQAERDLLNLRQMWRTLCVARLADDAFACALALSRFYTTRGWLREAETLFAEAQAAFAEQPLVAAIMQTHGGWAIFLQGRCAEAAAQLRHALAVLSNPAQPQAAPALHLLATAYTFLGCALREQGQVAEAEQAFAQGETLFRQLDDAAGLGSALLNHAVLCQKQGRHHVAKDLLRHVLDVLRPLESPGLLATPLSNLGGVNTELGLYAEAQAELEEAARYLEASGAHGLGGNVYNQLGALAIHRGDWAQAEAYLQTALRIATEMGALEREATITNDLGDLYVWLRRLPEALACFQRAHRLNEQLGSVFGMVINLNNMGTVQRKQRQWPWQWQPIDRRWRKPSN